MKKIKVCMISCLHELYDDRIYWKDSLSLQKNGCELTHAGIGLMNREIISEHGIRLIEIERKRYCSNRLINKLIKIITRNNELHKLLKQAIKCKADIYHLHDLKLLAYVKKLQQLPWHPKIVYSVHESYPDMIRDYNKTNGILSLFKKTYAWYIEHWEIQKIKHLNYIIAFDDVLYEKFVCLFGKDRVGLIYNFSGFSSDASSYEKKYDVIYTGSISEPRGIRQMIQAIELCKKKYPDIKLLILGSFVNQYLRSSILDIVTKQHLQNNVIFHDPVPHPEVAQYIKMSKIGIVTLLPIPKFYKNIPIKQFEYMSYGLPIVGSELPPIKNFIKPADAGILVNPLNPEEIAKAILLLLSNKEIYNKLSMNALEASKEKYNWSIEEKKLLDLYNNFPK